MIYNLLHASSTSQWRTEKSGQKNYFIPLSSIHFSTIAFAKQQEESMTRMGVVVAFNTTFKSVQASKMVSISASRRWLERSFQSSIEDSIGADDFMLSMMSSIFFCQSEYRGNSENKNYFKIFHSPYANMKKWVNRCVKASREVKACSHMA